MPQAQSKSVELPFPDSGLHSWLTIPTEQKPVFFYEGPHYYLSNFSAFALELGGEFYMTVEHAYQTMKIHTDHSDVREKIMRALSAHEAKKIARAHAGLVHPDWDEYKLKTMESLIRAKIELHPYVQKKLLETGDAILIENSPKDAFWGLGPDWKGLNHLGLIWMKLRAEQLILFPKEKQGGC